MVGVEEGEEAGGAGGEKKDGLLQMAAVMSGSSERVLEGQALSSYPQVILLHQWVEGFLDSCTCRRRAIIEYEKSAQYPGLG